MIPLKIICHKKYHYKHLLFLNLINGRSKNFVTYNLCFIDQIYGQAFP
jgi:hypothetical protein